MPQFDSPFSKWTRRQFSQYCHWTGNPLERLHLESRWTNEAKVAFSQHSKELREPMRACHCPRKGDDQSAGISWT